MISSELVAAFCAGVRTGNASRVTGLPRQSSHKTASSKPGFKPDSAFSKRFWRVGYLWGGICRLRDSCEYMKMLWGPWEMVKDFKVAAQ